MINMITQRSGSGYERAFASRSILNGSRSSFQEALLAQTDRCEIKYVDKNKAVENCQQAALTDADISDLAAKYGKDMSNEQYDAFLEELVDRGVLTNDDIWYLGYRGCIISPKVEGIVYYKCDEYGTPLEDAYGNSLDWTKTMSQYIPKSMQRAGLFVHAQNFHHEAFAALDDVLGRMDAQTPTQPYTSHEKIDFGFAARMEKLADMLTLADPEDDPMLKALYDLLSAVSKDVLYRVKAGQTDITQDEWTDLCRELKDAGIITEADFVRTRSNLRIVPIGYVDGNGDRVLYGNIPVLSSGLLGAGDHTDGYSGLSKTWTVNDWSGDPLQHLDEWIESLRKWRADLATQRSSDGTRTYGDLSPIERDINSCQKVNNLVRDLLKFV